MSKLVSLVACAAALCSLAGPAQALLINVDLYGSNGISNDGYAVGAGVFGSAVSKWNVRSRTDNALDASLLDDTGAASAVTVSYTRVGSGSPSGVFSGPYANLGFSHIGTGVVTFAGLTAGQSYGLVIYSAWSGSPSFTVGATTQVITPTTNWTALTAGTHYAQFQAVADGAGKLSFQPNANPTVSLGPQDSRWSALQLTDGVSAVPEPHTPVLMLAGLLALTGAVRRRQRAGAGT